MMNNVMAKDAEIKEGFDEIVKRNNLKGLEIVDVEVEEEKTLEGILNILFTFNNEYQEVKGKWVRTDDMIICLSEKIGKKRALKKMEEVMNEIKKEEKEYEVTLAYSKTTKKRYIKKLLNLDLADRNFNVKKNFL